LLRLGFFAGREDAKKSLAGIVFVFARSFGARQFLHLIFADAHDDSPRWMLLRVSKLRDMVGHSTELKIMQYQNLEVRRIPPRVAHMSCVGISRAHYPLKFGNYFAFYDTRRHGTLHCANMWYENLEEWLRRNPRNPLDGIEVTCFGHICFVTDSGIPKEWRNREVCLTGVGRVAAANLRKILYFAKTPYTNWICGCEKDDEYCEIFQSMDYEKKTHTNHCYLCGRTWDYVK
jgi:hypothetical protein